METSRPAGASISPSSSTARGSRRWQDRSFRRASTTRMFRYVDGRAHATARTLRPRAYRVCGRACARLAYSMQNTACNMQHVPRCMHHATYSSTEHATYDIQHATCNYALRCHLHKASRSVVRAAAQSARRHGTMHGTDASTCSGSVFRQCLPACLPAWPSAPLFLYSFVYLLLCSLLA